MRAEYSILVVNPNSTEAMTEALKPLTSKLGFKDASLTFFTAPSGPKSINNEDDAIESARHCLPHLLPLLAFNDAILVACYSAHPLVPILKREPSIREANKPVTGIFDASVSAALQLVQPGERFGIVSTGRQWEAILSEAVEAFLGTAAKQGKSSAPEDISARFAGVETTGLDATELHDAPPEEVRRKMMDATRRLVRKGKVGAICLGCAGMAGMNEIVREACLEELGEEEGRRVRIVDGVQAGVAWLEGAVRLDS
ncbi:Asp/Glu/hydantoin racemase [Lineolata rhizophorae]|uniref:Asp/Glu/hydantoin racemase n=1 Tax=Lineolata rhizophorae TaxID=578093 RepID=A0A6A6NZI4_9PEZI|nr:Asp/Glu/hydantoin racemase [Lineolata rhizophorae]